MGKSSNLLHSQGTKPRKICSHFPYSTKAESRVLCAAKCPSIWIVVFRVWQVFSSYVFLLFPSSSEAWIFPLPLLLLLCCSLNRLLTPKNKLANLFF